MLLREGDKFVYPLKAVLGLAAVVVLAVFPMQMVKDAETAAVVATAWMLSMP